ncbi:WD repeat-containing protein 11 [Trichonephila clavipes]|uniref:WD repeat-containing protein 11 n=1 Tax=Trichonephila clavipes TaxID=2585209 RepID=A0A8X6VPT7_TRICX|nr:WD repeat-containing protein 11 [Trichonephila clavipes]
MSSLSFDSSKSLDEKTTPIIQKVSPRTITGVLSAANKGALDWGWQSFVAYGCHNHVVVIDTQNVKVFQTLEKHTSDVVKVKWANENHYHDLTHPYTLKLASLDTSGLIVVWDVKESKPISYFFETGKPATDIEWLSGRDSCHQLLVGLHPPYSIVVWNTETGNKVWKKSYTETLLSFAFDPFSENNITFLASECILFVDDFNVHKTPSSNGRKFYISNPSTSSSTNSGSEDKNKTGSRGSIPRRMWLLAKADSRASEEGVTLNECLNLTYHKSYRHHLLLLYPKEILILDLEINQTVGIVTSEHTGSPMMQLHSCWQRDVFYILHESGCVSLRLRHRGRALMAVATPCECSDTGVNSNDASLEVTYDLQCQSDSLRLTKHAKVTGMAVCPLSEMKIALLVSDGRVLFLEVTALHKKEKSNFLPPYLSESLEHNFIVKSESESCSEKSPLFPLFSDACHPANTLADNIPPALYRNEGPGMKPVKNARVKMFITGHLSSLAAPPHVIRMCPPVTFRNWTVYRPLMAVGNASGSIQVINMATGIIEKEYALHLSPVRGIEWIGLTSFLSYSHPNTINSNGHVRNELVLTDLQSGRIKGLRGDRNEESPIDMIRVSYLRQYVIIAFKEEPFEIWDLRQLVLLRVMPKNYPIVTALEWSPGHYKKTQSSLDLSFDKVKELSGSNHSVATDGENTPKAVSYTKEHLVFTDTNGQLYHFSVEGNVVKHGSVIPADAMGSVTCIAWKGDHIVLGDVDGNLNIWNLKGKISKGIATHRGWIKKIRFGPGKGNMKILVLYNDGVDVWDVKDVTFMHQVRCPREMPKVQDVDWVGSDRPVLATADGSLRVTDIMLKLCSSCIPDYQPSDFPIVPHILSPRVSLYMKSFLHHILWKQKFNTDIDQQDDSDMIWAEEQLESLSSDWRHYLKCCPYGTAERCLFVSRIFGDNEGCLFWTVALHFLKQQKYEQLLLGSKSKEQKEAKDEDSQHFLNHPLDTAYDFFCDSDVYKKLQLDRVRLHLSKRTTYSQTQQCAERLLLLGQTDQAVQLLLETESENDNFYEDCLRACLIATVQSSGTSQSIIKLVSTNLIASGRISEGVQLLCLIEKASDGCRYLQGAGRWDEAVWLAKATLPVKESKEILKRWVDYLCSPLVDQKNKAILALLSMHEFWKVIKLLYSAHMLERAALFLQSCLEFGLLTKTPENSKDIDTIFMDYSRYLLSIKNRSSAIHYCKLVSDIGDDLRKQFQFISDDI